MVKKSCEKFADWSKYIGKNTCMARVEDFGDRLGKTSVYPNFVHALDALMGSMPRAVID